MKIAAVLSLLGFPVSSALALKVGDVAPKVTSVTHTGEKIDLGEVLGEGVAFVYFYPKADTPGCTAQACSLRDAYEAITEAGVTVYGVSMDSVEAQARFQRKHELPFTLIADPSGDVAEAFGVPHSGRFASRQAFLFRNGEVVWRDLRASTKNQADDVMAALAEMNQTG